MRKEEITLLTAASATGAGVYWSGGAALWSVYGTWGGATAQMQYSPDQGTTWIDVDGATLTGNGGYIGIPLPEDQIRVAITGGSGVSLSSKLKLT